MSTLLNALYLLAAVLFLTLVFIQTLRQPPPPERRADWPLRQFWLGDTFRHLALVFTGISAVGMIVVVIGGSIEADRAAILPALLGGGIGLVVLGAVAVIYSVILYWQPSPRKPHGF